MKKIIIYILFSFFVANTHAQKYATPQIIKQSFYSNILKDSIYYVVYLPYNWSPNEKHPCIYLNSYGALTGGNGMLFAADVNNFVNQFPSTVVVEILSGDLDKMNYDYNTGNVGETGLNYIRCLQDELFPQTEKNYNTTKFRAFIGQSQSSSYANYLFLHQPGLFNAYILFNPEKLGINNPPFIITYSLKKYYDTHYTFYYVAAGGQDYQRRIDYANEIAEKIKALDTNHFFFEHHLFSNDGHMSTITTAHLSALKFLFKNSVFSIPDSVRNFKAWFDSTNRMHNLLYGIDIPKSQRAQWQIISGIQNESYMDFFADYFDDSTAFSLNDYYSRLNNTALQYFNLKAWNKAVFYAQKLISVAEYHNDTERVYEAYNLLVETVYLNGLKDKTLAWQAEKENSEKTNYPNCKFILGQIAANNKFNLDEGIICLKKYINDKQLNKFQTDYSVSDADLLIAKCYFQKGDKVNTKKYLDESLKKDPNNNDAIEWKKEMKL